MIMPESADRFGWLDQHSRTGIETPKGLVPTVPPALPLLSSLRLIKLDRVVLSSLTNSKCRGSALECCLRPVWTNHLVSQPDYEPGGFVWRGVTPKSEDFPPTDSRSALDRRSRSALCVTLPAQYSALVRLGTWETAMRTESLMRPVGSCSVQMTGFTATTASTTPSTHAGGTALRGKQLQRGYVITFYLLAAGGTSTRLGRASSPIALFLAATAAAEPTPSGADSPAKLFEQSACHR
jgi:hypothetical protein